MRYIAVIFMSLFLAACCKPQSYAAASQLPPIKFPPHSIAVSERYSIPKISSTNCHIIEEIKPPYY